MKHAALHAIQNTAQLALFEQPSCTGKKWTVADIWSQEWNLAINLAIITACTGQWLKLKDMAKIASEFAVPDVNYPAFAYQVKYLGETGRLVLRANKKSDDFEWSAA